MTSYTNLSQNINISSFNDLLNSANTTTEGTFWTMIYWIFIVVIFLSSIAFGFEIAIVLALFGGFVIGWFLLYLGLINVIIFGVSEAVLLFVVIYLMYSSNRNQ